MQRGDFEINTFTAQSARRIFWLIEQGSFAFVLKERHEMLQFDLFPVRQSLFCRPRDEFAEQCGIGFLRVLRLSAFVTQILQKIFDERIHGVRMKNKQ